MDGACSDLEAERNQFQSTSGEETGKDKAEFQCETVRLQRDLQVCQRGLKT